MNLKALYAIAALTILSAIPALANQQPLLAIKCTVLASTDVSDHMGHDSYSAVIGEVEFATGESGTKQIPTETVRGINGLQAQRLFLSDGTNYVKVWVEGDDSLIQFPNGQSAEGDNYVTLRFRAPGFQPTPYFAFFCSPKMAR